MKNKQYSLRGSAEYRGTNDRNQVLLVVLDSDSCLEAGNLLRELATDFRVVEHVYSNRKGIFHRNTVTKIRTLIEEATEGGAIAGFLTDSCHLLRKAMKKVVLQTARGLKGLPVIPLREAAGAKYVCALLS